MSSSNQSRRHLLKGAAMGAATAAIGNIASAAETGEEQAPFVVAHMTDIHVKPEGAAPTGMRAAMRHVHSLSPRPDMIFQGGDAIMSSLGASFERTKVQWQLWKEIMRDECSSIEVIHAIGNHDIWGWQRSKAGTTGDEPLYGKAWPMQELELERSYYSFTRAGWKFIVLDSVQERGDGGYWPVLDDEQFEWLEGELKGAPSHLPICILSHVPIITVTPFFFSDNIIKDYQFKLIGALAHQDVHRIKDLLAQYPQVKVCLAGHDHLLDRVDYNGVTYFCNGAVSGSWWHGKYKDCEPGYALMRFFPDGTVSREYIQFPMELGK